jgi:hypothetical protein
MLFAAMHINITDAAYALPFLALNASIKPMHIGNMITALAVVEGDNGAMSRFARATDSNIYFGFAPSDETTFNASLLDKPETSIAAANMNPDRMINIVPAPYVDITLDINCSIPTDVCNTTRIMIIMIDDMMNLSGNTLHKIRANNIMPRTA